MRRLSDIDLRLLRVFATIVDCNGFKNAQISLNMAPSTISSHLSNLETRLGSKLCERGRRGFRLTRAGEATYAAVQELFKSLDRFDAEIDKVHRDDNDKLRIGIIDTVATFEELNISSAIADFKLQSPGVFIDLEVLPPQKLQAALIDGHRDVIIAPEFRLGVGFASHIIATESHRMYCGATHPWFCLDEKKITKFDLAKVQLSVRSYHYFDDTYKLGGVRASASVTSMEAQEILILSGGYVGFLPIHRGERRVAEGRMRAIKPKEWTLTSRFMLAYEPTGGETILKQRFSAALLRAVGTL